MMLWILFCCMTKDRHHAELKAEEILNLYGYERIELKASPGGFRIVFMYIPGVIEGDIISTS